jgi:hypothetical protein
MDFSKLTVIQLKALAKGKKLRGYSKLRKAELVDFLSSRKSPRKSPRREKYNEYNLEYLKKLARERKIKGFSRLRKAELINLLLSRPSPSPKRPSPKRPSPKRPSPKRPSPKRPSPKRPSPPKYTEEQVEIVQKILNCKDPFSCLGLTIDSTEPEIRKKFLRLSLLVHPDKNKAPGSTEAFIKLQNLRDQAILNIQIKEPSSPKYTKEQYDLVQAILKATSFDVNSMIGLTYNTTIPEIKKKFLRLSALVHPDKNKAPGSTEAFQKLQNLRDQVIRTREWFESTMKKYTL